MNENNNGSQQGGPNNNNNNKKRQPIMLFVLFALIAMFITSLLYSSAGSSTTEAITYSKFLDLVEKDQVKSVVFDGDQINIKLVDGAKVGSDSQTASIQAQLYKESTGQDLTITYYTAYISDADLLPLLKEHDVEIDGEISDSTAVIIYNVLSFVIPIVLLWILMSFLMKRMGGGAMGVGKSNAKVYVEKSTGVTFKDVAGQDEAKESLQEVVDFLHNPQKYTSIGAKLPKGALLVGPPGTGKTLLAKAVAGEAGVPFFSLAGSDFVEMFVGVGASRVRDLFKEAQKAAPCIIFIDEIDAIGKSRDSRYGGGNDEREQTLNQLLAEMDGFDTSKGLLILAATNRPEVLDKALLRPGRFDRRIIVSKPDMQGRIDTLKVHSKNVKMDETVDFKELALATSGAVGADLANIINEAALMAVRNKRDYVSQKDLIASVEVVFAGKEKKEKLLSPREKKIVAYHEVGHALVAALQKNTLPIQRITIVPRTSGALGYVWQVPEEEKYLNTEKEIRAMLVGFLGGRAAEEIVFDTVTTGASNDIEKATRIARAMVTQYGMSKKFGLMGLESQENQYLNGRTVLNCSDMTAAEIDKEVMHILKVSYEEAKRLLSENREALDKIAAFLIEKETITGKEFMKIFHEVKGIPELEEKKQEGEDRIEMPEAAKTGDEVQPVKTAEETNAENSQNQQKLEGKPADEAPADETPESAEAVAAESPNEDEMRGGSSFDRK